MVEKKNLRIVYMGTPDFAVEALRCLVEGGTMWWVSLRCPTSLPDGDISSNSLR